MRKKTHETTRKKQETSTTLKPHPPKAHPTAGTHRQKRKYHRHHLRQPEPSRKQPRRTLLHQLHPNCQWTSKATSSTHLSTRRTCKRSTRAAQSSTYSWRTLALMEIRRGTHQESLLELTPPLLHFDAHVQHLPQPRLHQRRTQTMPSLRRNLRSLQPRRRLPATRGPVERRQTSRIRHTQNLRQISRHGSRHPWQREEDESHEV